MFSTLCSDFLSIHHTISWRVFFNLTKYQEINNGVDQLSHCSLLQTKVLTNDLNCTGCISMNILLEELFHLGVNSFTFRKKGGITTTPSYTKGRDKSPCKEKKPFTVI